MDQSTFKETVFNEDTVLNGNISFKGVLKIKGKYKGQIDSEGTLVIGKNAQIEANINVNNVVGEGSFHGNINANGLVNLHSTAKIFGDIKANKLIVEEGVLFVGKCDVQPSSGSSHEDQKENTSEDNKFNFKDKITKKLGL